MFIQPLQKRSTPQCVLHTVHHLGLHSKIHPGLKDLLTFNLGCQTLRHPPLILEYKEFLHLDQPVTVEAYKLLASPTPGATSETPEVPLKKTNVRSTFKYGVLRDPAEFLEEAKRTKHPVDSENFLHQVTKEAIQ